MTGVSFYHPGDYGRVMEIPDPGVTEAYRSPFRRDYARIVHAPAFRRLQRKLQLFPGDESDFFRNRLTHSAEVAQIAKSIAIRLNHTLGSKDPDCGPIDTDLVETISLAHDLGHPPFGHTGEAALHKKMHKAGGFEGNAQTLRILTRLEKRQTIQEHKRDGAIDFVEFGPKGEDLRAGLNLCFRTLAGVLKYDKPIPRISDSEDLRKGYYASEAVLVEQIKKAVLGEHYRKFRGDFEVIEMQIMDLADDIAYSTYDFEDALKAGFASPLELLMQVNNEEIRYPVAAKLFKTQVKRDYPKENPAQEDKARFAEIQKRMTRAVLNVLKDYFHEADRSLEENERQALSDPDPEKRALAVELCAEVGDGVKG